MRKAVVSVALAGIIAAGGAYEGAAQQPPALEPVAADAVYAGTLSTAGGIVFYGQASGEFAAVDAATGAHLWHFETQETWKSSPMTYVVNGRQYVAIASGANVLSFALP